MNNKEYHTINETVKEIKNKQIWKIINSVDYNLILNIGRKCRKILKSMESESSNKEIIIGEFSLKIYCIWRIELNDEIILSWKDNTNDFDHIFSQINGTEVIGVNINKLFDLRIVFSNNMILSTFSDIDKNYVNKEVDSLDYYQFSNLSYLFTVSNDGIRVQEKSKQLIE